MGEGRDCLAGVGGEDVVEVGFGWFGFEMLLAVEEVLDSPGESGEGFVGVGVGGDVGQGGGVDGELVGVDTVPAGGVHHVQEGVPGWPVLQSTGGAEEAVELSDPAAVHGWGGGREGVGVVGGDAIPQGGGGMLGGQRPKLGGVR